MKNRDPRIDAYIEDAAPFARPVLRHLRALVHEACPDVEEGMKWGSPSFLRGGKILCGMAAFKAHCAFGFWHREMRAVLAKDGEGSDEAMGSLGRITGEGDLPSDRAMKGYLRKAVALNESEVPARPRPAARAPAQLPVPDDLAAALKKDRAAAKGFEDLTPGRRKEYVEWIAGAKREETRQRRLATALEWLAEGKSLNWRYENC